MKAPSNLPTFLMEARGCWTRSGTNGTENRAGGSRANLTGGCPQSTPPAARLRLTHLGKSIAFCGVLLASGCSADRKLEVLKASEACFIPIAARTTQRRLSKTVEERVPWVSDWVAGSLVLGEFKMSADFPTILASVQYNALRVGADAVLIKKLVWWDIRAWNDPKTVYHTTTIQPTDEDRKTYEERLKSYEQAKQAGKKASRPEPPKATHKTELQSVPGQWETHGAASLEALYLQTSHPVDEAFGPMRTHAPVKKEVKAASEIRDRLSVPMLEQAGIRINRTDHKKPSQKVPRGQP
jgi:hypothetical protein